MVNYIVPDETALKELAQESNISGDFKTLCGSKELRDKVQSVLSKYGKQNGLQGFESIKAVCLDSEPFTVENNLLSPTFKFKRHEGKKYYQKEIDDDKKFALMEIIIQALTEQNEENLKRYWQIVRQFLIKNFDIHQYSIFYWCCFDNENLEDCWQITPYMRTLWKERNGG